MYYFKQTENRKETKSCTHVCGWKCVYYLSGVHSFLFYFNLVNEEREEKGEGGGPHPRSLFSCFGATFVASSLVTPERFGFCGLLRLFLVVRGYLFCCAAALCSVVFY